jgi:conjugative transposon TraJ protein
VDFDNLHQILRTLYEEMMPLCADMAGVARGVAGLGALFYVTARVWQSLSRAEPVDVYPLLRPFAIGLCILLFPAVLGTINAVMSPVVIGTHSILEEQTLDMNQLRMDRDRLEDEARRRDPEQAYLVDKEAFDSKLDELGILDLPQMAGMYIERIAYNMKKAMRQWVMELLELIFQAAALIIDTIRTFFLVVLAILGPIAFAISVWDGFQSTLTAWISRYISVYLWLPVSDLFSTILAKLQSLIITRDIARLEDPSFIPDGTSAVYIVFMLIGIIGYFTIPSVANWIIQAGGMGNLGKNVNTAAARGSAFAGGLAGAVAGNIAGHLLHGKDKDEDSYDGPDGRNQATGGH